MLNPSSKLLKNSNFYNFSFNLINSRLFYKKIFKSSSTRPSKRVPFKALRFELTGRWGTKNIYFAWDLLRTIFYFRFYFMRNPNVKFYRTYYSMFLELTSSQPEFYLAINFLAYYRRRFPKLSTRNYLNNLNNYDFAIRESQNLTRLPFNTIFDFYNWKTKVPIKFVASQNTRNERDFYLYLYRQIFAYKNLKTYTL